MDVSIHHDPFAPDSDFDEISEPVAPPEPYRHADDKKSVAAVRKLIAPKVDVYERHVRATLIDVEPGETPEPFNHTESKDSIIAVSKMLPRRAVSAHEKRIANVAA